MRTLPDWAVAVRLVLSEVGADRVLQNRYGLIEAMGVIETVKNRMDPAAWNPEGVRGLSPWPGCGPGRTFADCANPQQYYGMSRDRALRPASAYGDREMLLAAIDTAVSAWWLLDSHVVTDVTNGATSFGHYCGGAAYGQPRAACDGSGDVAGANGVTGPIVFSGPRGWSKSEGRYNMGVTQKIDYRRASSDVEPGLFAKYLWGDDQVGWSGDGLASDTSALRRQDDGVASSPQDTGATSNR
jgi:hypothetical protein